MKKTQGKRLASEMCEKQTNNYIFENFPPMTFFDHQQLILDLLRYGTPVNMSCSRIEFEVYVSTLSKRLRSLHLNNDLTLPDVESDDEDPMQVDP
jgi:hypothetical protein